MLSDAMSREESEFEVKIVQNPSKNSKRFENTQSFRENLKEFGLIQKHVWKTMSSPRYFREEL